MNKKFYVYVDLTLDGVPFYVGKGDEKRIKVTTRNKHHTNIKNKHGMMREIVVETSSEWLSGEIEKDLIADHHTFVGDKCYNNVGCNYTLGGEGVSGRVTSEATRKKMQKPKKQSTRDKMSTYAKNRPPEVRKKIADSLRGKSLSRQTKDKIRQTLTGRTLTEDHKNNIKKSMSAETVRNKMGVQNKRENLSAKRLLRLSEVSSKGVMKCDRSGNVLETFPSINAASKSIGVSGSAISHVLCGWTKTCQGYLWKYASVSD